MPYSKVLAWKRRDVHKSTGVHFKSKSKIVVSELFHHDLSLFAMTASCIPNFVYYAPNVVLFSS